MSAAELARALAANVAAIARHETAGQCFTEVKAAVDTIERMINRPIPDRFLGPCPVVLTDNYGERICNTELTAGRNDETIQCPSCKATHDVKELQQQQFDKIGDESFTVSQLYKMILPIMREYVPLRTLQHWAATSKLIPTGYDSDGEPRFLLNDVRALRDAKPQKAATGRAAKRRAS
ncbi:hypothetical protein AWC11_07220 [Mycobacterium interjectum]|nr:hypothetical protein AWC11_07220 [Mycobacterium interjectum]